MASSLLAPIALTGIKGVGKSSVGRKLALRTAVPFLDLDDHIVSRFCRETMSSGALIRTARDVYRRTGKDGFMRLENEALSSLPVQEPAVLATGGGIADNSQGCRVLSKHWTVVLLVGNLRDQFERIVRNGIPPFLDSADPWNHFVRLSETRLEKYRAISDVVVDATSSDVDETTDLLLQRLKESNYAR